MKWFKDSNRYVREDGKCYIRQREVRINGRWCWRWCVYGDVSIAAGLKMMGYTHITKRGEKPLAMIEMPQGEPIVHAMNLPAFLCLGKGEVVPIADIWKRWAFTRWAVPTTK